MKGLSKGRYDETFAGEDVVFAAGSPTNTERHEKLYKLEFLAK